MTSPIEQAAAQVAAMVSGAAPTTVSEPGRAVGPRPTGRECVLGIDVMQEAVIVAACLVSRRARQQIAACLTGDHILTAAYRTMFLAAMAAGAADPSAEALDPVTIARVARERRYGEIDIVHVGELLTARPDAPAESALAIHITACEDDYRKAQATALVTRFIDEQKAYKPAAELREHLVAAAKVLEPPADVMTEGRVYAEASTETPAFPTFALRHFEFCPGRVDVLHGLGEGGKTILAAELEIAVAAGLDTVWGGLAVELSGPAGHLSWEMPAPLSDLRLQRICRGRGFEYRDLGRRHWKINFPGWFLNDKDAEQRLSKLAENLMFLTIDSFRAACPGVKENDSEQRRYLDTCTRVSSKTGCVIVVLMHDVKGNDKRAAGQSLRGSGALYDALGSAVQLKAKGNDVRTLTQSKRSVHRGGAPVAVRFVDEGKTIPEWEQPECLKIVKASAKPEQAEADAAAEAVNAAAQGNAATSKAASAVLRELEARGPMTRTALYRAVGGRRQDAVDAVERLVDRGEVLDAEGKLTVAKQDLEDEADAPF